MLSENPTVDEVRRMLRARIEELEETIRQLREPAPVSEMFPRDWGLSVRERDLLAILFRCRTAYLHRNAIMDAIYGDESDEVQDQIVGVWIFKMRKKLKPFGMTIESRWGLGYFLPEETKEIIRNALETRAGGRHDDR